MSAVLVASGSGDFSATGYVTGIKIIFKNVKRRNTTRDYTTP